MEQLSWGRFCRSRFRNIPEVQIYDFVVENRDGEFVLVGGNV